LKRVPQNRIVASEGSGAVRAPAPTCRPQACALEDKTVIEGLRRIGFPEN